MPVIGIDMYTREIVCVALTTNEYDVQPQQIANTSNPGKKLGYNLLFPEMRPCTRAKGFNKKLPYIQVSIIYVVELRSFTDDQEIRRINHPCMDNARRQILSLP